MKKQKIAMLLAMALTLTQGTAVPALAEELAVETVQEPEIVSDDSDVEVVVEADEELPVEEEADVSVQDDAEEALTTLFSSGDDEGALLDLTSGENTENKWYEFNYDYVDTIGNGQMLPNSQMTISMKVWECTADNWEEITDYTVEILPVEGENDYTGKADISVEGDNILINSHGELGWYSFNVKVLLNGEEILTRQIGFGISEYVILPDKFADEDGNAINLELGEQLDIANDMKPQIVRYIDGKGDPIPLTGDNYKVIINAWKDEGSGAPIYDYDSEGWNRIDVEGQELPILERTSPYNTYFALTAMEKIENGDWIQIARRTYFFDTLTGYDGDDGYDGDIWHDDDSEAESGYFLSFGPEQGTIGNGAMLPNTQMIMGTELRDLEAENGVQDYKLEIVEQSKFAETTVSEDGKKLIIESGDDLGEGYIYISVQIPDENGEYKEVFKKDIYFEVTNRMLMPQTLLAADGNELNPDVGESIDLSKMNIGLYEYRDGQFYEINDPNLKICIYTGEDEETGEMIYDYDVYGWTMKEGEGQSLPTMTRITKDSTWFAITVLEKQDDQWWNQIARINYYFDAIGDGDSDGDGGDYDEWYDDNSEAESDYQLAITFPDSIGNGAMLTNSQMTIATDLVNCKDDYSQVEDYRLEIVAQSKFGTATVSEDGKNLLVESGDRVSDGYFYVSVQIPDGNGGYQEAFKKNVPYSVTNIMLKPQAILDENGNEYNPKVGDTIDLSKIGVGLYEYRDDQFYEIDDPNLKICIYTGEDEETGDMICDYDVHGWTLQNVEGQSLPTITRITSDSTWFALTAFYEENGSLNQISRKDFYFDAVEEPHTHNWETGKITKDATCTTDGIRVDTCECGATKEVTIPATGHTEVTDKAEAATCEGSGKTEGSHCSVCNKVLKEQDTIPATGHTEVTDAAVAATCEGAGKTEGSHCSVCNKVLEEQKTIPATGHTEVTDKAEAATCEGSGKTEGKHCSVCNKVLKEQDTIPATGHTEVTDKAVAATALTAGKTAGSHCSVCGKILKKQDTVAKLTPTISLTASSLKMKTSQSTTAFKASKFAKGDYVAKVTSGNSGIVKVTNVNKNGTFKLTAGKKTGSTTVTVSLASGKKASFKVTVQKSAVKTTKVTTSTKNLTLKKGATYKKLASSIIVSPVTSKEKITYSSSNKKVATVSSKGVITAKKAGTAKITVKSGSKKVVVTVKVTKIKTTKLSGVPSTKSIKKGKSFQIKAKAAPSNTDDKITYKSSNKKVATVTSKGVVKGLKKGTATITVQSGSKKMTCKVTVK